MGRSGTGQRWLQTLGSGAPPPTDSITLPATGITADAGAGDDTLTVSGNGSDRIIFAKGYGHDTLTNPGSGYNRDDTLALNDINPWEVQFTRSGDAMTLSVPLIGIALRRTSSIGEMTV